MKSCKTLLLFACLIGALSSCDTPTSIMQWYLTDPHIPFADVIKGGKLKIKMGREPVDKY